MCFGRSDGLEPNAAGIDVGHRRKIFGSRKKPSPTGRTRRPVRVVAGTLTEDLERLTIGSSRGGGNHRALESTGVIGFHCSRFRTTRHPAPVWSNAANIEMYPGRRTDCTRPMVTVHCTLGLLTWLQFGPGQDMCDVRTVMRHGNELVSRSATRAAMHKGAGRKG